jgi:hypothetical protein
MQSFTPYTQFIMSDKFKFNKFKKILSNTLFNVFEHNNFITLL